jgi:hypothetical protein
MKDLRAFAKLAWLWLCPISLLVVYACVIGAFVGLVVAAAIQTATRLIGL